MYMTGKSKYLNVQNWHNFNYQQITPLVRIKFSLISAIIVSQIVLLPVTWASRWELCSTSWVLPWLPGGGVWWCLIWSCPALPGLWGCPGMSTLFTPLPKLVAAISMLVSACEHVWGCWAFWSETKCKITFNKSNKHICTLILLLLSRWAVLCLKAVVQ